MKKRDAINKLLIMLAEQMLVPVNKAVEFSFVDDDLKVIKKIIKENNVVQDNAIEFGKGVAHTPLASLYPVDEAEAEKANGKYILELLQQNPVVLNSDDFVFICRLVCPKIDSLIKTNSDLIDSLAQAAKIYFGVDKLSDEKFSVWLKAKVELYAELLQRAGL